MPPYQYSQLVETIHSKDRPKDRSSWRGVLFAAVLALAIGASFAYYF